MDAASFLALKNKIVEVSVRRISKEETQTSLFQTVKNEASGLFIDNLVLNIKIFRFIVPDSDIDVGGKFAFKGSTVRGLSSLGDMLKKTEADFSMSILQKLSGRLTINQVSGLFNVSAEDEVAGCASTGDINETLRLTVDSTTKNMARGKYLTSEDDNVKTHLTLQNNGLKLNGRVLQNDPELEFDEPDFPNN